jgi:predicted dehydrogenase
MKTKTIGFLDIDPHNFHAEKFLGILRDPLSSRGWVAEKVWSRHTEAGSKWAAENGMTAVTNPADLADCDGFIVIAPSNPEAHLELASMVMDFGRPIYIDKPFADTLENVQEIYRRADGRGIPVFSTSALRFTPPLRQFIASKRAEAIKHVRAWGGSGSFQEYAIHPLEMAISILGSDVTEAMHVLDGNHTTLHLRFTGGRSATVYHQPDTATTYQIVATTMEDTTHLECGDAGMFVELTSQILNFFETGASPVPRAESLRIRQLLDMVIEGSRPGIFQKIDSL